MSVNKVILIGHLGKDPEVKYVSEGIAVGTFTIATTEKGYTAKNGTQIPDRTDWHNIVLWRGLAEVAEKYLHKGDKVYIEGKIRTRSYEQNGITRYVTEVFADNMEMLGSPQRRQEAPAPAANMAPAAKAQPAQAPVSGWGTDDLPF